MSDSENVSPNLAQQSVFNSGSPPLSEHRKIQSDFEDGLTSFGDHVPQQSGLSLEPELYYHDDRQAWATPHSESVRHGGGAHAGILYTSEPLIRNEHEQKYWNEVDQGARKSNRGPGGSYQYGIENFNYGELSQAAQKLYRGIRGYTDKESLLWIAAEENINVELALTELRESGAIENHPGHAGIIRRIVRRL